jgi:hypothetical protein
MPPEKAGAAPSVSNEKWKFSVSFPPWQGFPCQLPGGKSVCGGSSGGSGGTGGDGSCPVRDDTSGTFGQHVALTGVTSQALPCGGSVTLGSTQYSMTVGANRLAIVEAGNYNVKLFELKNVSVPSPTGGTTTVSKFVADGTMALPTYLCMPTGAGNAMEKSVDIRPPVSQIFSYNSSTSNLVVRISEDPTKPYIDPLRPDGNPNAVKEKYLVVPISGGKPNLPDCSKETDHYKENPPAVSDIDIAAVMGPVCDATTLYPNSAACQDKLLVVVTDDPILVHEPERTAQFVEVEDTGISMVKTSLESLLMMQNDSIIRIGNSGLKFTLPDGGTIPLKDGKVLAMRGPVEVNGSGKTLKLINGGQIEDGTGTMISTYGPNSIVTPNAELPYYIRPGKRVLMPEGLLIPGKAGGYIRLPVTTQ